MSGLEIPICMPYRDRQISSKQLLQTWMYDIIICAIRAELHVSLSNAYTVYEQICAHNITQYSIPTHSHSTTVRTHKSQAHTYKYVQVNEFYCVLAHKERSVKYIELLNTRLHRCGYEI